MMDFSTEIWRYDKNQLLFVDGHEISLIQYLKQLREKKNITKKKISNLIKHNDYWYSQVERNGKKGDDNRQRTIYRADLINLISILLYDADTASALESNYNSSVTYIDKVLKAVPLKSSARQLDWLTLHQMRTDDEQEKLLNSLLATHEKLLRQTFNNFNNSADKDNFLNALRNMNTSLRIDPLFVMFLVGLPFADFLYEAEETTVNDLLRELMDKIDKITIDNNSGKSRNLDECMTLMRETIVDYTKQSFIDNYQFNIKNKDLLTRLNAALENFYQD